MITDKLNIQEFENYTKEFFNLSSYNILKDSNTKLSFKDWIILLGNTEWKLNTGLENLLIDWNKNINVN